MRITRELAEILGLLRSEGCHVIAYFNYWEKERGKLRYRELPRVSLRLNHAKRSCAPASKNFSPTLL